MLRAFRMFHISSFFRSCFLVPFLPILNPLSISLYPNPLCWALSLSLSVRLFYVSYKTLISHFICGRIFQTICLTSIYSFAMVSTTVARNLSKDKLYFASVGKTNSAPHCFCTRISTYTNKHILAAIQWSHSILMFPHSLCPSQSLAHNMCSILVVVFISFVLELWTLTYPVGTIYYGTYKYHFASCRQYCIL